MAHIKKINEMSNPNMVGNRIGGKKVISYEDAEKMLFNKLNALDMGDDVYDLVSNILHRFISEIEDEYTIVNDDGEVWDDNSNGGEMWYDELEEDFRDECYGKIKEFL